MYVQGRQVTITESKFQSLCNKYEEFTLMAYCGQWYKMEKKLLNTQIGGPDLFDEIRKAKMLDSEDKRAFAPR